MEVKDGEIESLPNKEFDWDETVEKIVAVYGDI